MRIHVSFIDRVGITQEVLALLGGRNLNLDAVEMVPPNVYIDAPTLSPEVLEELRAALLGIRGVQAMTVVDILPGQRRRLQLDALLAAMLVATNAEMLQKNGDAAIDALTTIAERVFTIYPFKPDVLPANWQDLLRKWLQGEALTSNTAEQAAETMRFIESGLVYRLPWAMEAIRVRAQANGDSVFDVAMDDFELGLAVAAVETGTLNRSASLLIQAGFSSRLAAIKAVTDTGATFDSSQGLRQWLRSEDLIRFSALPNWPTPETRQLWVEFVNSFEPQERQIWAHRSYRGEVTWQKTPPPPGTPIQLHELNGQIQVLSCDGSPLGLLGHHINRMHKGLLRAAVGQDVGELGVSYLGPEDL